LAPTAGAARDRPLRWRGRHGVTGKKFQNPAQFEPLQGQSGNITMKVIA